MKYFGVMKYDIWASNTLLMLLIETSSINDDAFAKKLWSKGKTKRLVSRHGMGNTHTTNEQTNIKTVQEVICHSESIRILCLLELSDDWQGIHWFMQ